MMNYSIEKIAIGIFIGCLLGFDLNAQETNPEGFRTTLDYTGQSNVGEGTGRLGYEIEIATVQSQGVTMPVKLVYDGGGLKVNSYASWVGQGWNLITGGAVQRLTNGAPDDLGDLSFTIESPMPPIISYEGTAGYLRNMTDIHTYSNGYDEIEGDNQTYKAIAEGNIDLSPDIYDFQVASGFQGSFTLGRRSGGLQPNENETTSVSYLDLKYSAHKISANTDSNSRLKSFKLTDYSGIKYEFDEAQTTHFLEDYNGKSGVNYHSSWLLTKITDELESEIFRLDYYPDAPLRIENYSASKTRSAHSFANHHATSSPEVDVNKSDIHEIIFDEGKIEFVRKLSEQRSDLPGHYALDHINVYNADNIVVKRIEFITTYNSTWNSDYDRLILDELRVYENPSSSSYSKINFEYSSHPLPLKDSRNIDHWGYFNGSGNSQLGTIFSSNLLENPTVRFGDEDIMDDIAVIRQFDNTGIDRQPSLTHTMAGSLLSVEYPGGKTVEFEYELNEYSYIEKIENEVSHQIVAVENEIASSMNGEWGLSLNFSGSNIETAQWVQVRYDENGGCNSEGRLVNYHDGSTSSTKLLASGQEYDIYVLPGQDISVHTYNQIAEPPCDAIGTPPSLTVQYKTHDENDPNSFRKKAGGLRIKRIITKDNHGVSYARNFDYNLFSDEKKSSGIIVSEPNTLSRTGKVYNDNAVNQKYIYSQSSSLNQAAQSRSNPVYYTNIEEYTCKLEDGECVTDWDSKSKIGRIKKFFTYTPPDFSARVYPFLPTKENNSQTILLAKEAVFDIFDNPVSKTEYDYDLISKKDNTWISGNISYPYQFDNDNGNQLQWFKANSYKIFPEISRLYRITETKYNGAEELITETNFGYVNQDKFANVQKAKEVTYPDGKIKEESTYYSFMISAPASIYDYDLCSGEYITNNPISDDQCDLNFELSEKGRFLTPIYKYTRTKQSATDPWIYPTESIQILEKLDNDKVVVSKNVEREMLDNSFVMVLTDMYVSSPLDREISYSEYTDQNFALQSTDNNEIIRSNMSTDNNLLVATIENAALKNARYTSFENGDFHGGWDIQGDDTEHVVEATGESDYAITGNYYYNLGIVEGNNGNFNSTTSNPLDPGKYLLTYWSKNNVNSSYGNGGSELSHHTFDEGLWEYHEKIIEWSSAGANFITMSGDGFIDELRLTEVDGTISTKGYYPDGKTMFESDPSGAVVTYEYDNKGRLEWVLDRERNVMEYHEYEVIGDGNSINKHVNYTTTREGMSKVEVQAAGINDDDVKREITYSDGFGRFRQKINFNVDQSNRDKIVFAEYDKLGRSLKKHLPYYEHLSTDDYIPIQSAKANQLSYYSSQYDDNENTDAPYAVKKVENNPLQRTIEQGGVGTDLQPESGHSTQLAYGWNTTSDPGILKWEYNYSTRSCSAAGDYPLSHLTKTEKTDPDGRKSIVWKDLQGREVAVTAFVQTWTDLNGDLYTKWGSTSDPGTEMALTSYTVYDDFGRVVYEIPAMAIERMGGSYSLDPSAANTVFNELITYYEYDGKGRLLSKQTPGQGFKHFVYDIKNRPVLTRDSQQMDNGKWSFRKYDKRGRVILQGETDISAQISREYLQNSADGYSICEEEKVASGGIFDYSNLAFPNYITEADVFTAYYFDDYGFAKPSNFDFVPFEDHPMATEVTRGLATGSKTRVFKSDGTLGSMLTTVSYYDNKGRSIQAFTENHKGGFDRVDTYYNLRGLVEKTDQFHKYESGSAEHQLTMRFTYTDQTGHLKNTYCKIDGDPEILLSNRYFDAKGQLKNLKLHRPGSVSNYLQRINYRYNAQGQLTHINNADLVYDGYNTDDDDVFGQELIYFENLEYNSTYDHNSLDDYEKQYSGNIALMAWKTKTPEEDGAMQSKNIYLYKYDGLSQMSQANYSADDPSNPGYFDQYSGDYNEHYTYFLGGNVRSILRNNNAWTRNGIHMDDLTFTYYDDSYRIKSVHDDALTNHTSLFKHFVDGSQTATEYQYDSNARLTADDNRQITMNYNPIGLPRQVMHTPSSYGIGYMYDAAGNKLQKYHEIPPCPPNTPCAEVPPYAIDYIGNFVYNDGELEMIYHPEGVIRPTPVSAENETEYVFDYFIKDYLGNVRAVITSEDALYTDKFLATMEDVHAVIEEENFDNLNETREDLPTAYPVDGSVYLNERIASLSAENGTEMGPSLVMPVKKGDKVSLSTSYFYEEDAPGTTYQNMDFFLNEILLALASSGSGVLNLGETQLINMASGGDQTLNNSIMSLLSTEFDTTDVDKPHAYLVWMFYDQNMNLDVANSGAAKVENPNALETIIRNDLDVSKDGYLHTYVSNGSEAKVNFDNFLVQYQRGKLRQINDYYPYGLTIAGLNSNSDEYLNKYTTKELQTGEFDASLSTGLEMFDFGSRFYDPQLGVWFTPDPAEQFSNPYLAMGNNPVMYVDPDGRLAWFVPVIIGAAVGAYAGGAIAAGDGGLSGANWNPFGGDQGSWQGTDWYKGAITGGIIGAGIGLGVSAGLSAAGANITGLGGVGTTSGIGTFGASGASSFGWNITSNALITANINIASTAMQGGDWDAVYKSGLVGLGAGAIGGLAGSLKMSGAQGAAYGQTTSAFGLKASKTQNLVTNVLNGGADRYVKGIDAGLSSREALSNGLWGAAEGLISASLVNKSNYLDGIGVENVGLTAPGLNRFNGRLNYQFFRYASSGISSAITSTPGAGFFMGRHFLAYYPLFNWDPLMLMLSPMLSTGRFGLFPGLQRMIVGGPGDNYPYASPFFSPRPGQ